MVLLKCLKSAPEETSSSVEAYFDSFDIDNPSSSEFLRFTRSLTKIFPVLMPLATKVYMSDACLKCVLQQVAKISSQPTMNNATTIAILQLISNSCTSEQCRNFNAKNYLALLKSGTTVDEDDGDRYLEIKILSTLCIIKIWNFLETEKASNSNGDLKITVNDLYFILVSDLKKMREIDNVIGYTVEGLAYLTLNGSVRQKFRLDEDAIENIFKWLQMKSSSTIDSSFIYGLILILSNLCKTKEINSSTDSKTKNFLKSVSVPDLNSQKNNASQETDVEIKLFNKSLLSNHNVIDVISKVKVYQLTTRNTNSHERIAKLVISIIHLISVNQTQVVKRELASQGALNIVLDFLVNNSKVSPTKDSRPVSTNEDDIEIRLNAIRSLARMLTSVIPKTAFKRYDIKTCIPFLVELLGINISRYDGKLTSNNDESYLHDVTNLDKFESLLALTNLSSDLSNQSLRQLIITKCFDDYLNNFILETDVIQIQRAAWELISNLISEPLLLAKFFNLDKPENKNRLGLMLKFLESDDEPLQIVIAGLLANATAEFQMVDEILVRDNDLCNTLLQSFERIINFQNSATELIKRIAYTLANLVFAVAESKQDLIKLKNNESVKKALQQLLMTSRSDPEVIGAVMEITGLFKTLN